MIISDYSIAFL